VAGCGTDGEDVLSHGAVAATPAAAPRPGVPPVVSRADATAARPLIQRWADAVRRGDARTAARSFALPAVIDQGRALVLRTPADVLAFNAGLPCGALLLGVEPLGAYVVGTFRLVERKDHDCGSGRGERARVAFLIQRGRFREWRQLPEPAGEPVPDGKLS
jgi:hypothetical protein